MKLISFSSQKQKRNIILGQPINFILNHARSKHRTGGHTYARKRIKITIPAARIKRLDGSQTKIRFIISTRDDEKMSFRT